MKQTQTKVEDKTQEKCWAMNNADLIIRCVESGILQPVTAGEYLLPLFEVLGIQK